MRVLALCVACSLFAPASAWALSCASGPYHSIPKADSVDVPTNAKVTIWYAYDVPVEGMVRLVEADSGEEVEWTMGSFEDAGGGFTFTPNALLKANTSYSVEVGQDSDNAWEFFRFETGSETDETEPATPDVLHMKKEKNNSYWGQTNLVITEVEVQEEENLYYRVEVSDNASFEGAEVSTTFAYDQTVTLGQGLCNNSLNMSAQDVDFVRLTAIDQAGNESLVSEVGEARGCSSVGAAGMGVWASFALFPVLLGRRRMRTSL